MEEGRELDLTQAEDIEMLAHVVAKDNVRHEGYDYTVEYAEEMGTHAFELSPGDLLDKYRPLENKVIGDYRREIYQPISYAEFNKALNVTNRIFSDGFHSIQYQTAQAGTKDEDQPEQYFEYNFAGFGSLMTYASQVILRCMLGDPNALIAVERKEVQDDGKYPDTFVHIWGSANVMDYVRGQWYMVITNESSIVDIGGGAKRKEGKVYKLYTIGKTWRIEQVGKINEEKYRAEVVDMHEGFPQSMAMFLGGGMWSKDGVSYFKSFFDAARPHWNKLVREDSDQDGSVVRHAHPQKVYFQKKCTICGGSGSDRDQDNKTISCTACKGTGTMGGTVSGTSAYTDIEVDQKAIEDIKPSEVVHVVEESTAMLEFSENRISLHKSQALESLNMQAVEGVNDLNSGHAKSIDRQDLNQFLKTISDRIWDIVGFLYRSGTYLRYGNRFASNWEDLQPVVSRPIAFDYVSLDILFEESKRAKESGMNSSMVKEIDKAIVVKKFGKSSDKTRRMIAEIELTPYYGEPEDRMLEVNALSPGAIDPDSMYVAANIGALMEIAISQKPDFIEWDRLKQSAYLRELGIELRGGPKADDPDAAAKAKIRGSVGGVQALITLNQSVALGEITPSVASSILVEVYGIDPSVAPNLIGANPTIIPAIVPVPPEK